MNRTCLYTLTSAVLCLPMVISLCSDTNCTVCNNGDNNCEKCIQGFTVTSTGCSPCPKNCLTCTAIGYCQSCSPGFWGSQCLYTCPDNCNEAGCDMTFGSCFQCKIGWYGPQCRQECNRCENDQCNLRNCSTGCKDGYVQEIYNDLSNCIPCPSFCEKCTNASFCTQCYAGHYIYQYTSTAGISTACLDCSSVVAKCVNCTFDQNKLFCGSCEAGYVVSHDRSQCITTVTCNHCQNGCDSEGRCFGGCQLGWYGPLCNYACSYACNTCINQDACLSCKNGFYTQTCNVSCATNCKSGNYPRCRFSDGYCSNGCNKGFWGDQCEINCNNNCLDITNASELCHINGTCYYGCKSGYMGSDCSQVTSVSTSPVLSTSNTRASTAKFEDLTTSATTSRKQTKTNVNATEANVQTECSINCPCSLGPAIGGSIAGGFVLGVLAAAVVFYLRERSLQKEKDQTENKNMYYNVSMAASHEEQSQAERQLDINDITFTSALRQCEATRYEKLSEQNKGNLYDDLAQPSENEVRQEIGKLRSNVEYYNN